MKSELKERGQVTFPEHTGERIYMVPFTKAQGLPKEYARWQPTVDAMLADIHTDGPIYLMVDQGEVSPNKSHRRPRPHIDGNWIPEKNCHSTGSGSGGHKTKRGSLYDEAVILASDVSASCAYVGEFNGEFGEGGDCSHLDLSGLNRVQLQAGRAYSGNVTMIHESLPVNFTAKRTLVRLNVPHIAI